MTERVLITGLGVVSPIGTTTESYWRSMLGEATLPEEHPGLSPGQVENRLVYRVRDDVRIPDRCAVDRHGRSSRYAIHATHMALRDAGLSAENITSIVGVSIGTGMGDYGLLEAERDDHQRVDDDFRFFFRVSACVAAAFDFSGPNLSVSTACSASGYSLSLARDAIVEGAADVVVAGGADVFSRVAQGCFNRMRALDPEVCRPFSAKRRGTVGGEGAAILILESESHFRKRKGSHCYGEIRGCGWSCDGYQITAPEPSGAQAEAAVLRALAEAGADIEDIDCVLAHGTGTELNDVVESETLERLFGGTGKQPVVCAIKSKLGHSGGAAAAFSCVTGALVLQHGMVPPTANVAPIDPRCRLQLHQDEPVCANVSNVLVNAYAFGGNNISIILGKYADGGSG